MKPRKMKTFLFDQDLIEELRGASKRMATSESQIVRGAVRLFLEYHDEHERAQYEQLCLPKLVMHAGR